MGCNCGKKRRPLGSKSTAKGGKDSAKGGKASGQTMTFELITPSGHRRVFGSRLEASAERVRLGGGVIRLR